MGNSQSGHSVSKQSRQRKKSAASRTVIGSTVVCSTESRTMRGGRNALDETVEEAAPPMPVDPVIERAMTEFVNRVLAVGIVGLKQEWQTVAGTLPRDMTASLFEFNMHRNYPGASPCLDATRVLLWLEVPPFTEYIHANWVNSVHGDVPKMIVTQAPQDQTMGDFWRMIYQEKVRVVILLCDKYENGRRVYSQYWPLRPSALMGHGRLHVHNNGIVTPENETAYEKYQLTVNYRSEPALKTVLYTFKNWKDGFVPESSFALLRMIRAVVAEAGPLCVHGAAGNGRPGVFAAIMIVMRGLMVGQCNSVMNVVMEIREQRMGAVMTEIQYLYIYRIVCEYIQRKGIMKAEVDQVKKQFNAYKAEYMENFVQKPAKYTSAPH